MIQVLLLEQSWSELYVLNISQNPQLLESLLVFIEQSRDNDDIKNLHVRSLKAPLDRLQSLDLDHVECLFLKIIYFLKPGKLIPSRSIKPFWYDVYYSK